MPRLYSSVFGLGKDASGEGVQLQPRSSAAMRLKEQPRTSIAYSHAFGAWDKLIES